MRLILTCLLVFIAVSVMADTPWTWHKPCSEDMDKTRCDVWFNSNVPAGDITVKVDGSPVIIDATSYQSTATASANAILLHLPGLNRNEVRDVKAGLVDLVSSFRQPHQQIGLFTSNQDGFQILGAIGDSPEVMSNALNRWRSPASVTDPSGDLIETMRVLGGNLTERKVVYWLTTAFDLSAERIESISTAASTQHVRLVTVHLVRSDSDLNISAGLRRLGDTTSGFYSSVSKDRWENDLSKYAMFSQNGRIISFGSAELCGERSLFFSTSLDNIPVEHEEVLSFRPCQAEGEPPGEETTTGAGVPEESPAPTGETTPDDRSHDGSTGPTGETASDEGAQEEPMGPTGETPPDEGTQDEPTDPTEETPPDEGTQDEPMEPTRETPPDEGAQEEPSTTPTDETTPDEGTQDGSTTSSTGETSTDEGTSESPADTDSDTGDEQADDVDGLTPDEGRIPAILLVASGLGLVLIILVVLIKRNRRRKSGGARLDKSPGTIVIEEAGQLRRHELTKFTTRIGRSKENDIVLTDDSVSAFHALIKVGQDGRVSLTDLNSTNHSFINGVQVTHQVLSSGDSVRLGLFSFTYEAN